MYSGYAQFAEEGMDGRGGTRIHAGEMDKRTVMTSPEIDIEKIRGAEMSVSDN